ncbi:lipase 1 [Halyomorpha halys]|uniref:lipase 1 n=1 Tax=Halyomorpha halys TaxID=286706 RepID=UPI0034D254D9
MLLFLILHYFTLQGSVGAEKMVQRSPPVMTLVPSINELAERGGYKATNYELITEDGYSIWLHRIGSNSGSPVLIQHGIMLAADSWITRGHNKKDLAFMLLGLGYDVWLSNHRGTFFNEYSTKYNKSNIRFWDFSFHESGIYDLPAAIDKILEVRQVEKIFYVGHSLGTATFAVMCTAKPEYNNKIKAALLMSPVIYLKPINRLPLLFQVLGMFKDLIISTFSSSGNYNLGIRTEEFERGLKNVCGEQALTQHLCLGIIGILAGENSKNINKVSID